MAVNYFAGKSQAWLEAELEKAQADFAAGKTITTAGSGDVQVGKLVQMDVRDRIQQLLRALYAIDPEAYPASNFARVSRTRIVAYQS